MRFIAGFSLALAGLASCAVQDAADVFIFGRHAQSSTRGPRVPKEVARHILLQRASNSVHGHAVHDIPETIDESTAISYVNTYGKSPASLFGEPTKSPSQLVVIIQGMTPENSESLRDAISASTQHTSFAIPNPPSSRATSRLLDDFRHAGVSNDPHCGFESAVNPFDKACWKGSSSVVLYDAKKKPSTIETVISNLPRLLKFVSDGDVEATLVLLPESSRSSKLSTWHSASFQESVELRRRELQEHVLTDAALKIAQTKAPQSPADGMMHIYETKPIPQCFTTLNACTNRTNSCSGKGMCKDKYGNDPDEKCFLCICNDGWGGNMCHKEDISAAFWLIAGFTIVLVGAVSFAIGLLYNMGQEKLPGVIGAGVGRSKQ